jgi:stalled ribosome alternative rescue factor ArfA
VRRIAPINPVAKALALSKRRAGVVPPKKGKGSYGKAERQKGKRVDVPENSGKEKG